MDTPRILKTFATQLKEFMRGPPSNGVVSVYYSRKNFLRPELQPEEHRSFDAEVEYLDSFFQDGHAYCMGSLKQDRWYLYTYRVPQLVTKLADHTLEILMTDLDEDVLHTFTKDACENGKDCTEMQYDNV
ncbi:putative adenosylmethionine decarboxylase [Ancylostoma caninum]|uniref:Putative adenosylmethionine decarboxylase n=1 Tax=Ancylostoma caninum TaxID=29170 RepID=A0A368GNS0_ANCCA|nr:putative adenosylmethionine decarboxylase [Ancylostoma caninum]